MAEESAKKEPEKGSEEPEQGHSISYLLKWTKAAKKAAKGHWDAARAAYAEYNREQLNLAENKDPYNLTDGYYGIYHSSCKTMEPALYALTPTLTTNRNFDNQDEVIIRRCGILERLGSNLVKGSNIDDVMRATVQDYIHADKAAPQVVYTGDVKEERRSLRREDPELMDTAEDEIEGEEREVKSRYYDNDEEYEGEVLEDDKGQYYTKKWTENQKIYLAPLPFDEVIHDPEADTETQINMKGYKFRLTWDEVEDKFPEKCEALKTCMKAIGAYTDEESRDSNTTQDEKIEAPGKWLEGWEIYDKKNNCIYWICEDYKEGKLDTKPYVYGLEGFFPSPKFRISSKPPKSLYPKPEFCHIVNLIQQLHELQGKIFNNLHELDPGFLVDGSEKDAISALNGKDRPMYVAAENMGSINEKGGISGVIQEIPTEAFFSAIQKFSDLKAQFKEDFFEHFGTPDIIRGISDATETAAAQEIKAGANFDRFRYTKKQIRDVARDAIEMMIDLALRVYDDNKIAEIVGGDVTNPDFLGDLEFLRNDTKRTIQIDIETDSTNFANEQQQIANKKQIGETLVNIMNQVSQMLTAGQPGYAAVCLMIGNSILDSMPGGKAYVQEMKGYTMELLEQAKNPPPAPPPPPDYKAMQVEIQGMKAQNDNANKGRELDQKEYKLNLETQKQEFDQYLAAHDAKLNARIEEAYEVIESTRLKLEQANSQIEQINKLKDNDRLEFGQMLESIALLQDQVKHSKDTKLEVAKTLATVTEPSLNGG